MPNPRLLQIAIDGPVAAGKGDIAERLANRLHIVFVNTGAMYRALALACIEEGYDTFRDDDVMRVLEKIRIRLQPPTEGDKNMHVFINEVDVTERLTEPDVSRGSSIVAAIPTVRPVMVRMQQEFAKTQSVVMEGRDIGLRVLPNAPLKIYLTASLTERAKRRWIQWHKNGIDKTLDETIEETRQRDKLDQERTVDPLQILPDAWVLDTTGMTQDDVVNAIIKQLQERSLV
jgi:cytidylate kinase